MITAPTKCVTLFSMKRYILWKWACLSFSHFRYCQEFFTEEFNRNGACEFAPDCFKASLEYTTVMKCARCMLYHCMSDSEGEMPQHPCECVPEESVCSKRCVSMSLANRSTLAFSCARMHLSQLIVQFVFGCLICVNAFISRWIGLFLLSMIFPCLCLYPACHGCHKIGISCGICGGKHRPQM